MNPKNPFETFQHYAFRLEALPQYLVDHEKESFAAFIRSGDVSIDTDWATLVAKNVGTDKKMERLRLFSEKLTDYERYEVQAYPGPQSGEVIRTALRKDFEAQYAYDFWFFDDEWIAQVHYEDDGTFVKFDVRAATDQEKEMFRYWHGIFENAKPLKQVPFVSNTPDDSHCLQAAYMGIAKYFDSDFSIPMDEWSQLTGYEEGLGTWANAGLVWFKEQGYDVKHIELYDYQAFMADPKGYMVAYNGVEAGTWGYEHTNVPAEIERMKNILSTDIIEQRIPTIDDIKKYLDEGYVLRATINSQKLNGEDTYVGHAVIITNYNDTYLTIHDPGLPGIPNRQVTYDEFEAAWADPTPRVKELDAIRRR
jgi:hypothetical protein